MSNIIPIRPSHELTFVETPTGWLLASGQEFSVNLMGEHWTVDLDTEKPYVLKLGGGVDEEGNDSYISVTVLKHKIVSVIKTTPMVSFSPVMLKQFSLPPDHSLAYCFHVIRNIG